MLRDKYKELETQSIKDALLEDVEKVLKNWKQHVINQNPFTKVNSFEELPEKERRFRYTIIWQSDNSFLVPWHNGLTKWDYYACAGSGYKKEIDTILKAEGFKGLEDYGSHTHRPSTTYVFNN